MTTRGLDNLLDSDETCVNLELTVREALELYALLSAAPASAKVRDISYSLFRCFSEEISSDWRANASLEKEMEKAEEARLVISDGILEF